MGDLVQVDLQPTRSESQRNGRPLRLTPLLHALSFARSLIAVGAVTQEAEEDWKQSQAFSTNEAGPRVWLPQNIGLLTVRQTPERRHLCMPFCLPDAFVPVKYKSSIKRLYSPVSREM